MMLRVLWSRLSNKVNIYANSLIDHFVPSEIDPFHITHLRLTIRLAIVFLFSGLLYGVSFLIDGYDLLASFTIACSLSTILIPFTLLKIKRQFINYTIYIVAGLSFASFNIFGSGNITSVVILLWLLLVVHLAFSILIRKAAVIFGILVLLLFLLKRWLVTEGVALPFWIDVNILNNPRLIDIIAPAFFNFYLAYTTNKISDRAHKQINQSAKSIQHLDQQVKEGENKYRQIVEQSLTFICIHSIDGKILFVNPACLDAIKYSYGELLHMNIKDIMDETMRPRYDQHINQLLKNGTGKGLIKARDKTGQLKYLAFQNTFTDKNQREILGFAQDVTELVNTRKILKAQEQELEVLISSLHDIVMLIDCNNKLIKCWSHIHRLPSPEWWLGKDLREVFEILFISTNDLLQGYNYALKNRSHFEISLPGEIAGQAYFFRVKISPILTDELSASIHIYDETQAFEAAENDRKKIEKDQIYKSVINRLSLRDLTAHENLNETLGEICLNAAFTLGVSRASLWMFTSGRSYLTCRIFWENGALVEGKLAEAIQLQVADYPVYFETLSKGKPIIAEDAKINYYTHELLENYIAPFKIEAMLDVPIFLQGKIAGVVCFEHVGTSRNWDTSDIAFAESIATLYSLAIEAYTRKNAQKELLLYTSKLEQSYRDIKLMTQYLTEARQKAEESDRLKSLFLANISHEIRTPMNAIMGFSELLERPGVHEHKRSEFTRLIRERSQDLLNIINDVLDISRIEAGQVTLSEGEGNIDELIDRMIEGLKMENHYLREKEIEFKKLNHLREGEFVVTLDFMRLYQVLNNLLTNALKFTKHGTITIECKLNGPGWLLFNISDTGIGIQPEKLQSLFKPFRQADDDTHRQYGGSGLGLAICKGLVDLWKGELWAISTIGIGSTFSFTIPFTEKRSRIYTEDQATDSVLKSLQNKKVLIIEDDPNSISYFCEIVEQEKMKSYPAATGRAGIHIFEREPEIDLVLLDIGLPDMSGIEVARHLIQLNTTQKIIILTAFASDEMRKEALNAGVKSFVTKPVNGNILIKSIREVFEIA